MQQPAQHFFCADVYRTQVHCKGLVKKKNFRLFIEVQGTWSLSGQALLVTVETIYRKNDKIEVETNMGNGGMPVDGNIGLSGIEFPKK